MMNMSGSDVQSVQFAAQVQQAFAAMPAHKHGRQRDQFGTGKERGFVVLS